MTAGDPRNTYRWQQIRDRMRRSATHCGICSGPLDASLSWPHRLCTVIDHIVPLDQGGTNAPDNLRAAHNTCNASKGAKEGHANRTRVGTHAATSACPHQRIGMCHPCWMGISTRDWCPHATPDTHVCPGCEADGHTCRCLRCLRLVS